MVKIKVPDSETEDDDSSPTTPTQPQRHMPGDYTFSPPYTTASMAPASSAADSRSSGRKEVHDEQSARNLETQKSHEHDSASESQQSASIPPPTPTSRAQTQANSAKYAAKKLENVKAALWDAAYQRLMDRGDSRQELRETGTTRYSFVTSRTTKNASTAQQGTRRFSPYPGATSPRAGAKTRASSTMHDQTDTQQRSRGNTSPRARRTSNANQHRTAPASAASAAGTMPKFGRAPNSHSDTSSHRGGTDGFGQFGRSHGPNRENRRSNASPGPGPHRENVSTQSTSSESYGGDGFSTLLGIYNLQWSRLDAATPELLDSYGLSDFPWPYDTSKSLTAEEVEKFFPILNSGTGAQGDRRSFLKGQLMRWHPDKFNKIQKFVKPAEWERVKERQSQVSKVFTGLLNRG